MKLHLVCICRLYKKVISVCVCVCVLKLSSLQPVWRLKEKSDYIFTGPKAERRTFFWTKTDPRALLNLGGPPAARPLCRDFIFHQMWNIYIYIFIFLYEALTRLHNIPQPFSSLNFFYIVLHSKGSSEVCLKCVWSVHTAVKWDGSDAIMMSFLCRDRAAHEQIKGQSGCFREAAPVLLSVF